MDFYGRRRLLQIRLRAGLEGRVAANVGGLGSRR